jgi:hypothetical protein
MFEQAANIVSSMMAGIHSPSIPFIPFLGVAWWIPMLISLLGPTLLQKLGVLGGGTGDTTGMTEQDQTTTTTALPSGYQSPTLGLNDLLMQAALGKNLSIFGGAGLPGGQTIAPDFLQDFMSLIGSSYTDLQKKYTNPTPLVPPTPPTPPETLATCRDNCNKTYPVFNDRKARCLSDCQWKFSGRGA